MFKIRKKHHKPFAIVLSIISFICLRVGVIGGLSAQLLFFPFGVLLADMLLGPKVRAPIVMAFITIGIVGFFNPDAKPNLQSVCFGLSGISAYLAEIFIRKVIKAFLRKVERGVQYE